MGALVVHPATVAVLPLVALAIALVIRTEHYAPNWDFAIGELAIQQATHLQQLLGPYSRFGWNHPGPLLSYSAVPIYVLSGHNGALAMSLTRVVLDAACLAGIVVVIDRTAGRLAAWGAAIGAEWFVLRVGLEWFANPWNPYAVVVPLALVLVVGASMLDGKEDRWRLLVLLLAASFVVQSHIGTGALVALGVVTGLVGFVLTARRRSRRKVVVDVAVAAGAVLVCWALPIWEQLTRSDGNAEKIARFFAESSEPHPAARTVAKMTTVAFALTSGDTGNRLGAEPLWQVHLGVVGVVIAVALLVIATCFAVWSWRASRRGVAAIAAMVPVGYVVALAAGLQIRGEVSPYLFAPVLAVGLVASATVGLAGAALVQVLAARRVDRGRTAADRAPRPGTVLGALALVLALVTIGVGRGAFDPLASTLGNAKVTAAASAVQRICATGEPVHLTTTTLPWSDYLALAAAIGECAPDVKVDPGAELLVGPRRTETLDHGLEVRAGRDPSVPPEAGWRRIWHAPRLTIDVPTAGATTSGESGRE